MKDLWQNILESGDRVVMWGMGNGADKILAVCEEKGIEVSDFFASDGFVRGHSFHGKRVLSYSEIKEKYDPARLTALLAFGSSRPEVLENVERIGRECRLRIPDVPVFGDGLFDAEYCRKNQVKIGEAESLFEGEDKERFRAVVSFRLTGDARYLDAFVPNRREAVSEILRDPRAGHLLDLGAYTGDSVREFLGAEGSHLSRVTALEPDARTFKKLEAYASAETAAMVNPVCAAAWRCDEALTFDGAGNRNSALTGNRASDPVSHRVRTVEVAGRSVDSLLSGDPVDLIKFDVEGSEKEALEGAEKTVLTCRPTLFVSLYHRVSDLFDLPLWISRKFPFYRHFSLCRPAGVPAWDLALVCRV